jgi:hypothetical protein
VVEMDWKTILKKLTLDTAEMCCTNLVLGFHEINNRLADHYEHLSNLSDTDGLYTDVDREFKNFADKLREQAEAMSLDENFPTKLLCGAVKDVLEKRIKESQTNIKGTLYTTDYIRDAKELLREHKECIQFGKTMRDKSMRERR